MNRARRIVLGIGLIAVLFLVPACQRTVDVKDGTRIVDAQGRLVSESVRTLTVPMSEAAKHRILTVTEESKLAGLYAEAQDAIAAGDLATAEKKLAEVLAVSPEYRQAKKQYDQIKSGKKVATENGGSSGGGQSPAPAPAPQPPAPSQPDTGLLKWIPDTIPGFTASPSIVDPLSVSRQYTASAGQNVATLIIAAEQFRTAKDANRALTRKVKDYYSRNSDEFTVNGHKAYFGTDGRRFAVIGFVDGAVMVAVEGSVDSGRPTSLKGLLRGVVERLP